MDDSAHSGRHPHAIQVRDAFVNSGIPGEWLAVLNEWYDPTRALPPGRRKCAPGHLVAAGATL